MRVALSPHVAKDVYINLDPSIPHTRLTPHHTILPIPDRIYFSLDYSHGLTAIWISMPRRHKIPSKAAKLPKPTLKAIRARASGTDGSIGIDLPSAGLPNSIFSYPNFVVACFRRYPEHQQSILVSHFALGLLILSVLANWGSISRSCCPAYRAISYLIEVKAAAVYSLT